MSTFIKMHKKGEIFVRYMRILIISVLLLLAFCMPGCAQSKQSQDADVLDHLLDDYSKAIADGVPSDMCLTLYNNIVPYISSDRPVTKEDLVQIPISTVIDSTELSSRIASLKKIETSVLQLPERSLPQNLMVYYCIETGASGKVLEVEISGKGGTMVVNGVEVQYDPVFFDIVSPYLDAWEYIDEGTKTDMLPHLLVDFSNTIADGVPSDMCLTLYIRAPYMGCLGPVRKAELIKTDKYVINSTELSSRIDQLNQVASVALEEPPKSQYKDLEVYYYIETEADGIVLDVEISRKGGTIFVNGMEVKYDPVFFELVEPYLDAYTMNIVPEPDSWNEEGP